MDQLYLEFFGTIFTFQFLPILVLIQAFKSEIMTLEDRIFNAYIELKSEPLVGRIKTGMIAGDFSWSRCLQPTDTRDYVKIVILELVIIHAQVGL
jgi:hypothetical protein